MKSFLLINLVKSRALLYGIYFLIFGIFTIHLNPWKTISVCTFELKLSLTYLYTHKTNTDNLILLCTSILKGRSFMQINTESFILAMFVILYLKAFFVVLCSDKYFISILNFNLIYFLHCHCLN